MGAQEVEAFVTHLAVAGGGGCFVAFGVLLKLRIAPSVLPYDSLGLDPQLYTCLHRGR